MKITVQSRSGTLAFDCADCETILHAGLRQGLTLPYECSTGTCGTCRARVTMGETDIRWKKAPGGARLKPEKGDILMCQTYPRSDCALQVPSPVAISEKLWPAARSGVICNVRKLTNDVVHFEVRLSAPMTFEAGQFVVLEAAGVSGGRAYSIVNYATDLDSIAMVLKRKPAGGFSDWLFKERRSDPEVKVFGPLGRSVFRPDEDKNILCIAGGSGIAGMMSILECAVAADYFRDHKGVVFFGVRTSADTFYLETLSDHVAASHGNLEVTIALSDEVVATPFPADFPVLKLASGMVHEAADKAMGGRYDNMIAYIAGPPIMVDVAVRMLIVSGFPGRSIRYDKFT